MAKKIQSKTSEVIKAGAQEVKLVAADALGAAGVAAAGVVLDRVAEGMNTGAEKVEGSKPKLQKAIQTAVAPRRKQRPNKAARKQAEEMTKSTELRQILNSLEKVDDEVRRGSLLDTLCSVSDVLELPEHPSPPGMAGGDLRVNLLKHQVRWCRM